MIFTHEQKEEVPVQKDDSVNEIFEEIVNIKVKKEDKIYTEAVKYVSNSDDNDVPPLIPPENSINI